MSVKYRIAFLDNEKEQLKLLQLVMDKFIREEKIQMECSYFTSGEELLSACSKETFEIMFFDVELDNGQSGIVVAEEIRRHNEAVRIVFITSYRNYAYDAFSVEANGYLMKPIDYEVFRQKLIKEINQIETLQNKTGHEPQMISFNSDNLTVSINVDDIIYIEHQLKKSIVVARQKEYPIYDSMKELEERLTQGFLRVSRGVIVNMNDVSDITKTEVIMKSGKRFVIGKTYKKEINSKFFDK